MHNTQGKVTSKVTSKCKNDINQIFKELAKDVLNIQMPNIESFLQM